MSDVLTLDSHTARFFAPSACSALVQERFELDVPGLGALSLRARTTHDVCGKERFVLQREGAHEHAVGSGFLGSESLESESPGSANEARCFIAASPPPPDESSRRFWLWELQRAVFDARSGAGVLVNARGWGVVAPLSGAKASASMSTFYRFKGETEGEYIYECKEATLCEFFSLSSAELGKGIALRLNERSGVLGRTWRFAKLDEDARCRAVFGCPREDLDRAREVLRWSLGREMALDEGSGAYRPERPLGKELHWLPWIEDATWVHWGAGTGFLPLSPRLRRWRDAVAQVYGCRFPQFKLRDFSIAGEEEMSTRGFPPLPGFKSWLGPLRIGTNACPTFHELVEANYNLERWARAHLSEQERQQCLAE